MKEGGLERYLSLDSEEKDVATRLEEYLVWAAKYSVPKNVADYERAQTNSLLSHISDDPDT